MVGILDLQTVGVLFGIVTPKEIPKTIAFTIVLESTFTLWLFNIAMENDPFIDDVPIKSDDFSWRTVSHNQRVTIFFASFQGRNT